eukprot:6190574-Pleurochrysis_carterae.AAC.1
MNPSAEATRQQKDAASTLQALCKSDHRLGGRIHPVSRSHGQSAHIKMPKRWGNRAFELHTKALKQRHAMIAYKSVDAPNVLFQKERNVRAATV